MLSIRRFAALIATTFLLTTTACGAGWRTLAGVDSKVLEPRQQAQVWMQDRMVRLHALRVSADSVRGIPYLQPLSCDTCWLAFPREGVDSIRVGDPPGGFLATMSLILAAALVVGVMTGNVGPRGT
jgi:hypothetical protein